MRWSDVLSGGVSLWNVPSKMDFFSVALLFLCQGNVLKSEMLCQCCRIKQIRSNYIRALFFGLLTRSFPMLSRSFHWYHSRSPGTKLSFSNATIAINQ